MLDMLISKIEKETGQSADYLRDVAAESTSAFLKYLLFLPMAGHRRSAPKAAWHAVRLVATRREDCGPCVQIVIDMALADGVPAPLLEKVWRGRLDQLAPEVAAAVRLAEAVLDQAEDAAARSEEVAALCGREALVDLAFAISTARVFPTLKRSLGHARSCALVDLRLGESALDTAE